MERQDCDAHLGRAQQETERQYLLAQAVPERGMLRLDVAQQVFASGGIGIAGKRLSQLAPTRLNERRDIMGEGASHPGWQGYGVWLFWLIEVVDIAPVLSGRAALRNGFDCGRDGDAPSSAGVAIDEQVIAAILHL